ncbi:MAG: hypothetical protein VKJ06_02420 [Vampirovibrionales bacterium]|nr:hypothetical protein [Vampirovibrionales bacterium]
MSINPFALNSNSFYGPNFFSTNPNVIVNYFNTNDSGYGMGQTRPNNNFLNPPALQNNIGFPSFNAVSNPMAMYPQSTTPFGAGYNFGFSPNFGMPNFGISNLGRFLDWNWPQFPPTRRSQPQPPAETESLDNPNKTVIETPNQTKITDGTGLNVKLFNQDHTIDLGSNTKNSIVTGNQGREDLNITGFGHAVDTGSGDDTLRLNDTKYGVSKTGSGNDTIELGENIYWSRVFGGEGQDTAKFNIASSELHIRDAGDTYHFVGKSGFSGFVGKDVEQFVFGDGKTYTKAQLDDAILNRQGSLASGVLSAGAETAKNTTLGKGELGGGTQLADEIKLSYLSTAYTGAGNDTINSDQKHNWIDAGEGNDKINLISDWGTKTFAGGGDDTLTIQGAGGGNHDGGEGNDTVKIGGDSFKIISSGTDTYRIFSNGNGQHAGGASNHSNFKNFEIFQLGTETLTAAEIKAKLAASQDGTFTLGNRYDTQLKTQTQNQAEASDKISFTGSDLNDNLKTTDGQTVYAKNGSDTIALNGLKTTAYGEEGNDTFNITNSRTAWNRTVANGGLGNDTFNFAVNTNQNQTNLHRADGGEGTDKATFDADASLFTLQQAQNNSLTLVHGESGQRFVLNNIETLSFSDGKVFDSQALINKFNQQDEGILSFKLA